MKVLKEDFKIRYRCGNNLQSWQYEGNSCCTLVQDLSKCRSAYILVQYHLTSRWWASTLKHLLHAMIVLLEKNLTLNTFTFDISHTRLQS